MPSEYIATSSALISLQLPQGPQYLIYLAYGGTPDKVKEALRRACSHRRTITIARPEYFLFNVVGQLFRTVPQDAGAIFHSGKTRFHAMRATSAYHYYIGISGNAPIITWGSEKHEDLTEPFFRWLGSEWRRPIKPRAPRTGRAKGGRPSNLRKNKPELFTNLPVKASAAGESKALGLKHSSSGKAKPNTVRIDRDAYRNTPLPNKKFGETLRDLDRAIEDEDSQS
jgi:hypothetical protein